MDGLQQLDTRLSSNIPTPVAEYGSHFNFIPDGKDVVYDGQNLPAFLLKHGLDPKKWRQFAIANRLGSLFELEVGDPLFLPDNLSSTKSFSVHPEA